MSEYSYDIEQLFIEGLNPKQIAQNLECPVEYVYAWLESEGLGE